MRRDARHPSGQRRLLHWLPTLLVLAMLATGLAAQRYDLGPRYLPWLAADPVSEPASVAPPAGLELPDWSAPALAEPAPTVGRVDPAAVATKLGPRLTNPDLGRHVVAAVGDLMGVGPDWTSGGASGDGTYVPASTTKLLTVAAALEQLRPQARFTTRVMSGSTPREVVLVGGGDPYLASQPLTPDEAAAAYPPRIDVTSLSRATARALGGSGRIKVRYDDSLFSGPGSSNLLLPRAELGALFTWLCEKLAGDFRQNGQTFPFALELGAAKERAGETPSHGVPGVGLAGHWQGSLRPGGAPIPR